jgi:ribonuclease J
LQEKCILNLPDKVSLIIIDTISYFYREELKNNQYEINKSLDLQLQKLLELSKKGLTCLLSDSTNAEVSRISISELEISKNLDKVLKQAESRVIISTFASSLDRVKSAIEASAKYDRKVVIFGRSMEKGVALARKVKYIDVPNTIIITPEQIKSTPPEKLTIICTGSQGEELAALNRMANGQHKHISLNPDDLVVFSSSPIPGNTMFVNRVINKLMRANVKIITNSPDFPIHASGHGTKEDLKAMLAFTKPKYFIPAHGEYKMLIEHGKIARDVGVKKENIFIIKNGSKLRSYNF